MTLRNLGRLARVVKLFEFVVCRWRAKQLDVLHAAVVLNDLLLHHHDALVAQHRYWEHVMGRGRRIHQFELQTENGYLKFERDYHNANVVVGRRLVVSDGVLLDFFLCLAFFTLSAFWLFGLLGGGCWWVGRRGFFSLTHFFSYLKI